MKALIFDTGPIITLATNNLLWILKPLKEKFKGEFFITQKVKKELIDKPLKSKKFKFEAISILEYIKDNSLKVSNQKIYPKSEILLESANSIFKIKNKFLQIVSKGEMEALALTSIQKANALVIDERTTRTLIEDPYALKKILSNKLHAQVIIDKNNLKKFQKELNNINIIRSTELLIIAYELGLFNKYITNSINKKTLLDGLLWGSKLRGCSISSKEIETLMKLEKV